MANINPTNNATNNSSTQNSDAQGVEDAFLKKIADSVAQEKQKKNIPTDGLLSLSVAQQNLLNQLLALLQSSASGGTSASANQAAINSVLAALAQSLGLPENSATFQQLLSKVLTQARSSLSSTTDMTSPPSANLSKTIATHLEKNSDELSNTILSALSEPKLASQSYANLTQQAMTNNAFSQNQANMISQLQQQAAMQNVLANSSDSKFTFRFKKWNQETDSVSVSANLSGDQSVTLDPSTPTVKKRLSEQLAQSQTNLKNVHIVDSASSQDKAKEGDDV